MPKLKNQLRNELKLKRRNIPDKVEKDKAVCSNLISTKEYEQADTVLFYAALRDEINIDECIADALSHGKKVALPVCTDKNGNMEFYYINSFNDIEQGFYGIREPNVSSCVKVCSFDGCVCIVPAIAYDKFGYRIGYGKGYYDRFLSKYTLFSIGLCYNDLVVDKLPADKFDVSVDKLITESGIIF